MSIWRPSTTTILVGGVVVVVLAAAIAFMIGHFQPTTDVKIGTATFNVRVAKDDTSRELGLSGVESLAPTQGLLMAYDSDGIWGIWMKDMKIPLDILWINSEKKVVYMVKNAGPELSTTKIFKSKDPARYILEVPAGSIEDFGIKVGDTAEFTIAGEVQ